LVLAVIAGALTLRLMVPAGWMPVPGQLRIVPCSGWGPMAAPGKGAMAQSPAAMAGMAMGGHHDPADSQNRCPYTALRMAADTPLLPPAILVSVIPAPLPRQPAEKLAPLLTLAAPPPAQTGPPRAFG
jgi:hypothetical protein